MAVVRTLIGNVRGPQGEDGSSFEFKKTYATIAAMNSDFSGSDTQTGDYVLIAAASADNADNGKMYRKGNSAWIYVAKISGPTGATGPAGPLCPLDTSMAVTVAGQAALDAALGPTLAGKLDATGDAKDNTETYTSDDVADGSASAWETVQPLTTGEKHESLFAKLSKVVKNVRFLYKLLGTTDISGIGSGTVTDILSALNSGKFDKANVVNNLTTTTAGYALDAREGKTLADNVSTLNDAIQNYVAVAPSEWTGSWDNVYSQPLTIYRFVVMTAEYNGQIMAQQMYPPSMLADKNVYLAYQDPTWNGRVKFTFNSAMTKCTVSQFNNFSKVKLYGIK